MKPSSQLLIRFVSGRQSTATMALLTLPLLLALILPAASQVYVNSSSAHGNTRTTALKPTNRMPQNLSSPALAGRTENPFTADDRELDGTTKTAMDANVPVGVSQKRDGESSRHPEEHTFSESKTITSTFPSSTGAKVTTQAKGGLVQTQRSTPSPIPSPLTQQTKRFSGKGTPEIPTSRRTEKPIDKSSGEDWSASETLIPTVLSLGESTDAVETNGAELAQFRPQAQTAYSILTPLYKAHTSPSVSLALQPKPSTTAPATKEATTKPADSRMVADETGPKATLSRDDLGGDNPGGTLSTRSQMKENSQSPSPSPLPPDDGTNDPLLNTAKPFPPKVVAGTPNTPPSSTAQIRKAPTTSKQEPNGARPQGDVSTSGPKRPNNKTSANTTKQHWSTDGTTSQSTTLPFPMGRGRIIPIDKHEEYVEKELSVSLGIVPSYRPGPTPSTPYVLKEPCNAGSGPCISSKDPDLLGELGASNGSLLLWADLSRTLSFAWELHVFGSAALFLLLTAGAALGLALAPSMHCPHRGALALANGLLLLTGAVRAAFFLLDPYGSRLLLPLPAITALYNLPLPLLLWAQAALVILVLRGAEVALLPPAFQRPPALAVLAILQCTLLLASDLLSTALSPAVPVVLQSLTLTVGLALCLGYFCLALPRLSNPQAGRASDKGVSGPKLRVLARVLAVCAFLGALCCLLHAYTCLWLYGLLGDWRRFRWAWWLCQFWTRLLELGWAFCLLLLASWVFWRPQGAQTGRGQGQGGSAPSDVSSPCQSSSSSHTHTCWAKIVQSLKGRPHRKSDSNGVGGSNGGGGVTGELPNNWGGQERSGVDISKSLIRNRDPPKDSNRGRNQRAGEASTGSLLRLQTLGQQHQCSLSSGLDQDKESAVSLYDFDLRPPSPIDLTRSIDEALHREHLLRGGSLFRPLGLPSPPASPEPWMRRNSDPQITLSDSSDEHTLLTESSAALDRSIPSAVPSRQVTAPPTPTHQGPRWVSEALVPSSVSCPVSLHPSPTAGRALTPSTDDTRPFLTPDVDKVSSQGNEAGARGYLKVRQNEDSASVSSDIIDL